MITLMVPGVVTFVPLFVLVSKIGLLNTHPAIFLPQDGWRNPDAVDLFARFTEISLPIVGQGVDWVCTINEPNIMSMIHGKREANLVASAPSAPDEQISEVLAQAHARSREVLRSVQRIKSGRSVATGRGDRERGRHRGRLRALRLHRTCAGRPARSHLRRCHRARPPALVGAGQLRMGFVPADFRPDRGRSGDILA